MPAKETKPRPKDGLARYIYDWRRKRNMSLSEFARQSGTAYSYISEIEIYNRPVRKRQSAERLGEYLGLPPERIMFWKDE